MIATCAATSDKGWLQTVRSEMTSEPQRNDGESTKAWPIALLPVKIRTGVICECLQQSWEYAARITYVAKLPPSCLLLFK